VYSNQTFRKRVYFMHPGYREYMKRVLRIALEDLHADLIHFDNTSMQAQPQIFMHPLAVHDLRAYLERRYTPEQRTLRFGFPQVEHMEPPTLERPLGAIDDPLFEEFADFRCEQLAAYYGEVESYIKISQLLRGGVQQVRVVLRALALRLLAEGVTAPQVAHTVPLTPKAIRHIAHRYNRNGLDRALYEKQRPGAQPALDDSQKQRIVARVCSQAPEGRTRWTIRLIVEEAIKRKLVRAVGRETIRILLQSHELKPWREKNVVRGGVKQGIHPKDGRRASRL